MFSFKNIYEAYKKCLKNKSNTLNAQYFQSNLIENLIDLENELKSRSYKIGKSICFLTHSPKLREVFAGDFRDRIVHHILVKELEKYYEKRFIFDVYNNRKDMGTHKAVTRSRGFMNAHNDGYYLQLDIKGFFYSLDKNILFKIIFNDLKTTDIEYKNEILWLSNKIIYHNPTKNYIFKGDASKLKLLGQNKTLFKVAPSKGLPIGNLTSQFFANIYMNSFDQFVKRVLKCKHYLRYVDDFVLFSSDKNQLALWYKQIKEYLEKILLLQLRDDHRLNKNSDGLDFLGYIIRPNYLLVRNRVVNNFKYKKARYLDSYEKQKGKMKLDEIKRFLAIQNSFLSHTKHADSYRLNQKIGVINEDECFKKMVAWDNATN